MAFVFDNVRFRKLLGTQPWDAYELLYKHYFMPLMNAAFRLTHDKHAAKDIVHDTFVTVWDARKKLERLHEKSLENYLARVVRNKSVSYYKRRRHLDLDVLMIYQDFASDEDTVDALISKELYIEFRKFIASLPPRQKECLVMKIDRLMGPDDIAMELKVTRKAVEQNHTIAMKKLKKWATGHN